MFRKRLRADLFRYKRAEIKALFDGSEWQATFTVSLLLQLVVVIIITSSSSSQPRMIVVVAVRVCPHHREPGLNSQSRQRLSATDRPQKETTVATYTSRLRHTYTKHSFVPICVPRVA